MSTVYAPNNNNDNSDIPESLKPKKIQYPIYKNMIESKGFVFQFHIRPFDIYLKEETRLSVCESCRIIKVNDERLRTHPDPAKELINFLFNQK